MNGSPAIPDGGQAGRFCLMLGLEADFAANPPHEALAQGIRAVRASELAAVQEERGGGGRVKKWVPNDGSALYVFPREMPELRQ